MSMRILKYLLIKQEMISMIKQIAWNTFKNTGNINTFLEYKQIENAEKGIQEIQKITTEQEESQKASIECNVIKTSK